MLKKFRARHHLRSGAVIINFEHVFLFLNTVFQVKDNLFFSTVEKETFHVDFKGVLETRNILQK